MTRGIGSPLKEMMMSDKLPGSSDSNPIVYQGGHIQLAGDDYPSTPYVAVHADYEPMHPTDERIAYVASVDAAKRFIDGWNAEEVLPS